MNIHEALFLPVFTTAVGASTSVAFGPRQKISFPPSGDARAQTGQQLGAEADAENAHKTIRSGLDGAGVL